MKAGWLGLCWRRSEIPSHGPEAHPPGGCSPRLARLSPRWHEPSEARGDFCSNRVVGPPQHVVSRLESFNRATRTLRLDLCLLVGRGRPQCLKQSCVGLSIIVEHCGLYEESHALVSVDGVLLQLPYHKGAENKANHQNAECATHSDFPEAARAHSTTTKAQRRCSGRAGQGRRAWNRDLIPPSPAALLLANSFTYSSSLRQSSSHPLHSH